MSLVVLLLLGGLPALCAAADPSPTTTDLNVKFFDELTKEREQGKPTEFWAKQLEETKKWSSESAAAIREGLSTDCATEQSETEKWIAALSEELRDSEEAQSESAVQRAERLARQVLGRRIKRLRKMLTKLNLTIENVNAIFSDAHITSVTTMVRHVFDIRNVGITLRHEKTFQDPIFDPIRNSESQAPAGEAVEDEAASFIDLGAYADRLDALASEAQAHMGDDVTAEAGGMADIKSSFAGIQGTVKFWHKIKVVFEDERTILAQLRDDLSKLLVTRKTQLATFEKMEADTAAAKAEESGKQTAASRFAILPKLKSHAEIVKRVCERAIGQAQDSAAAKAF